MIQLVIVFTSSGEIGTRCDADDGCNDGGGLTAVMLPRGSVGDIMQAGVALDAFNLLTRRGWLRER